MADGLAIAQVTPFAWETQTEVGTHVRRISEELCARGHRVLVITPSRSTELVGDSRQALRGDAEALLDSAVGAPRVLGVGELVSLGSSRRRAPSLPVDVARTIDRALERLPLDVVHVHDPFAPSAASAALRTSRALTVGTFHNPIEPLISTQLARSLTQLLWGRLDARLTSYAATRDMLDRDFPGDYRVIGPGADPSPAAQRPREGSLQISMLAGEEHAALRVFVRALRALGSELDWHATVWSARPLVAPATLSRRLQQRITFVDSRRREAAAVLAAADVLVLASEGSRPTPKVLVQALVDRVVPVASGLAIYEELLGQGARGLLFVPGDVETLTAQLARLASEPAELDRLRAATAPAREEFSYARVVDQLEEVYDGLVARRHDRRPRRRAAQLAVARRRLIDVDLHMHTDHSHDCATPVEVLLATARSRGLGAIAVTEHNEISGALAAAELAPSYGIKVIVGEEVKTASQGEVIGLFIHERIERGMSLQETIAEIKRQGGIVYVPHPFDRMHSVPDYRHLRDVLDDVDVIEIFNPRVAIAEFNAEAVRFAARYRMIAGAGSDAHVPQGLGSVRIRMHDFDGPEQFLESLRDADIIRNPASLLYVQALKFLQTKALPAGARRASRERRVRRAARNS